MRPNTDSLNYLSGLSDVSNQTNLVKNATCFKSKNKETLVNVMLTNKPKCFFKSHNFVLALSDFHKLTVSILRVQKSSKTFLKSYYLLENENFNQDAFLHDLDSRLIQGKLYGDLLNKNFWKTPKPFLINKQCQSTDLIAIEKDGELISSEQKIVALFNDNYINIAEISSSIRPSSLGDPSDSKCDELSVKAIASKYSTHPSVEQIKGDFTLEKAFVLPLASIGEINKIIKSINVHKATGRNCIPAKFVRMSADIIGYYLTNINNSRISQRHYSENVNTANVRPIFKRAERTQVENYTPGSLLNIFSKIYRRFIHDNLKNYVDSFLSKFLSAFRKSYSSNLEQVIRSEHICRCSPYGLAQDI